jgi:NADH:ubiquinone oxidoreductase subunit 5 (subunit L)/multisubunit Na+/H+ antiporter MnhA subunit
MKLPLTYVVLSALLLIFAVNPFLESKDSALSAAWIGLIVLKFCLAALSACLAFWIDKWIAPSIARFVDERRKRDDGTVRSLFAYQWEHHPDDPRLWMALGYYVLTWGALFIGLCL